MTQIQSQPQSFPPFSNVPVRHAACSVAQSFSPTHDEIAHRAYDLYVASDCKAGQCASNWRQAEQELIHASGAAPRSQGSPLV